MSFIEKLDFVLANQHFQRLFSVLALVLIWLISDRVLKRLVKRAFLVTAEKVVMNEPEEQRQNLRQRFATFSQFSTQIVRVVLALIMTSLLLETVGVNVKALIAGVGVIGLGISFAAQNLIRDYINGAMILIENQYNVGDWVEIDKYSGDVEAFTLRTTKIRDSSGNLIFIPNGQIQTVMNSTKNWSLAVVRLMLEMDTDISSALEVVRGVQEGMKTEKVWGVTEILPSFSVDDITYNSINIRIRMKTLPGKQWTAERELRARLKVAFEKSGIKFASEKLVVLK